MNTDSSNEFQYYEGFFSFRNDTVEVLMDEETFETYIHSYMLSHGMDTRTEEEFLAAATNAQLQRKEAEKILMNPDYWKEISDPNIRIIQRNTVHQQSQAEEEERK